MFKWYSIILIVFVMGSFGVVKFTTDSTVSDDKFSVDEQHQSDTYVEQQAVYGQDLEASSFLVFSERGVINSNENEENLPVRNWDVLDPDVEVEGILVHSLEENVPLLYKNSQEERPLASITKLLTAIVVLEEAGLNKKIPISESAVATLGIAGDLEPGEEYIAKDLLKIMLLVSSNDAAAAFEEYFGGKEEFAKLINQKASAIGMHDSVFYDGSGLSDDITGTPTDILKLVKYINKNYPRILRWTQTTQITVQPINKNNSKTLRNINPLSRSDRFLGGKTGTSDVAGENLAALFSVQDRTIALILFNSKDRYKDVEKILEWVEKAYQFN